MSDKLTKRQQEILEALWVLHCAKPSMMMFPTSHFTTTRQVWDQLERLDLVRIDVRWIGKRWERDCALTEAGREFAESAFA